MFATIQSQQPKQLGIRSICRFLSRVFLFFLKSFFSETQSHVPGPPAGSQRATPTFGRALCASPRSIESSRPPLPPCVPAGARKEPSRQLPQPQVKRRGHRRTNPRQPRGEGIAKGTGRRKGNFGGDDGDKVPSRASFASRAPGPARARMKRNPAGKPEACLVTSKI